MRIGIIIGRIGGVDGVALEAEKWIHCLNEMGHKVFIISGQYEERKIDAEKESILNMLSFFAPETLWEQNHAFFDQDEEEEAILEHVHAAAEFIAVKLVRWIKKRKLDVVISENGSALPSHLSMAVGIKRAFERTAVNAITHDHDFHWERGDRYNSNFKLVNNLVENTFPLRLNNSKHAVINLHAQDILKDRYGRDSVVVPNVMNFEKPFGTVTKRNKKLLKDIGLKKRDIPLFQITRIVRRKGIETAIDLVHRLNQLNKSNIKLVITGNHKDDNKGRYTKELINKIFKLKLNDHVIFASQYISSHFGTAPKIKSLYSLSDAYASAVACTYFSTYEGFGNAFVEAVLAKKPIFVNNYKPVFWPDIGSIGFKTVMLEDNKLTDEAVEEINEVLHNAKLAKEMADHNFALGKEHFSYPVLKEKLKELLKF